MPSRRSTWEVRELRQAPGGTLDEQSWRQGRFCCGSHFITVETEIDANRAGQAMIVDYMLHRFGGGFPQLDQCLS